MERTGYGNNLVAEGSRLCEAAGKLLIKDMVSKGINMEKFSESFGSNMRFTEDVDTANAGALFITGLAQVIRAAVEPNMVGLELLQLNTDLKAGGGSNAIKLPKEKRVTAAVVGEGGSISYTTEGYESITVAPYKIVAASQITWEMVHYGMISMITAEAARVGKALARKVDSDIITAISAVCTSANSNRIATGGASTRVSYNDLIDARAKIEGFEVGGFKATHLILHADDYAALMKDTDFKEALVRAPVVAGNQPGSASVGVFPQVEFFGPQKIIVSNQISSGTSLFVDSTELGTFVQASDVEIVDGRINGSVDSEIIALQNIGIGIQNSRAAASVVMASS